MEEATPTAGCMWWQRYERQDPVAGMQHPAGQPDAAGISSEAGEPRRWRIRTSSGAAGSCAVSKCSGCLQVPTQTAHIQISEQQRRRCTKNKPAHKTNTPRVAKFHAIRMAAEQAAPPGTRTHRGAPLSMIRADSSHSAACEQGSGPVSACSSCISLRRLCGCTPALAQCTSVCGRWKRIACGGRAEVGLFTSARVRRSRAGRSRPTASVSIPSTCRRNRFQSEYRCVHPIYHPRHMCVC